MFQIGERVVYGFHGVCTVAEMEERVIDRKKTVFMVLEPQEKHSSKFYIPTHNAAAMAKVKRMLTAEELEKLFVSDSVRNCQWIQDEKRRKMLYRELISAGNREKLMGMVRCVYAYKDQQAKEGKRVHLCDDNFIRDAERLLIGEVSAVFQMDEDTARQYIRAKLREE